MKITLWVAAAALVLAACGDDNKSDPGESLNNTENNENNTESNNASSNNTQSNNDSNNTSSNNQSNNPGNNNTGEVTYHGAVRSILERNCNQCHYDGGIGPFALDSYDAARPMANVIVAAVKSGEMPPWPPSQECGDFRDPKIVTPEELTKLEAWADAGMPEGDASEYVPPAIDSAVDLGEPDYVVDIGTDYLPSPPGQSIDDYHCFAIETNFSEDRFLTAYETKPGNIASVHHMLFWAVGTDQAGRIQQLENEDPTTPGWQCFGGNRVDDVQGMLGAWAPGTAAVQYGNNRGIRIPANSTIVVQIHYNTLNSDQSDRTKIDLHLTEDEPSEKLSMFPFPVTDLYVPAGEANGYASGSVQLPIGTRLYGVLPHMHQLGTRIKASGSRGGQETCFVDIPKWDFGWQNVYLYNEPMEIVAGTTVNLECWYDNSPANQPTGQMPRDITWGEGTFDEMCLNYFIIRELPF